MASPLVGIAGVNSLLFASYGLSRRIISPFPLSLKETAVAGSMAGAANAVLASPGEWPLGFFSRIATPGSKITDKLVPWGFFCAGAVEMFKVRMQGQYGDKSDKRLRTVVSQMWTQWGLRQGVMRGYWVGGLSVF
jgi:solute carrier family 25 carnitine/acylcarnitine transporter 20/29